MRVGVIGGGMLGMAAALRLRQAGHDVVGWERMTAAAWLERAAGKNGFDRVFGAQLRAKFGPSWDKIPMVWFWKKVQLRTTNRSNPLAKETLGYPRGSFQVFIDALEAEMRRI